MNNKKEKKGDGHKGNDPEFFLYEYTISSLIYLDTFDRVTFEVNK